MPIIGTAQVFHPSLIALGAPNHLRLARYTISISPAKLFFDSTRRRPTADGMPLTGAENPRPVAQRLSYSSWRRHQTPASLRPLGARSSHWYMPQRPSSP